MNKTKLFLPLILIGILLTQSIAAPAIFAQEETASPSAEQTTLNLKERIEKVVVEKRDQIKGAIDKLNNKHRGIVGQIQRVSQEAITIKNPKGIKIVPLTEEIKIVKGSKTLKVDEIAVDDWALVLGEIDEEDSFNPLQIRILSKNPRPLPVIVSLGEVMEIDRNSIVIEPRAGSDQITYDLTNKTTYQDLNGDEIERLDIEEEMQALVVGNQDDEDKVATIVRVLTILDTDE